MKTFKSYLKEQVELPSKDSARKLGLTRKEMPQIEKKDLSNFLSYLEKQKISSSKETVVSDTLKPSQTQFSKKKISGMMDSIETGNYIPKRILISRDNYVLDGHHTWIALLNLNKDTSVIRIDAGAKKLFDLMHDYPKSFTKAVHEEVYYISENEQLNEDECPIITQNMMKNFEKFVDRMFKKFDIDFDFTRHFHDRMSDERNNPCIDPKELASVIKKIYSRQGKSLKTIAGAEGVIKDLQSDLNIPVAVEYDKRKDEFRVAMKTIMRKKNFRTSNKVIKY